MAGGLPKSTQSPVCEGWLVKRGSGFPYSWKRRYVVAVSKGGSLQVQYYEADDPLASGTPPPSNAPPPSLKGEYILSDARKAPVEALGVLFTIAPKAAAKGSGVLGGLLGGGGAGASKRTSRFSLFGGGGEEEGRELVARSHSAADRDRWIEAVRTFLDGSRNRMSSVRSSAPPAELHAALSSPAKGAFSTLAAVSESGTMDGDSAENGHHGRAAQRPVAGSYHRSASSDGADLLAASSTRGATSTRNAAGVDAPTSQLAWLQQQEADIAERDGSPKAAAAPPPPSPPASGKMRETLGAVDTSFSKTPAMMNDQF